MKTCEYFQFFMYDSWTQIVLIPPDENVSIHLVSNIYSGNNRTYRHRKLWIIHCIWNFEITQIWVCWFQICQYYFQIPAKKTPESCIFDPKFKDFYFSTKLCNKKNSSPVISNITLFFSNSNPKNPDQTCLIKNIQTRLFFVPDLGMFYFLQNLEYKKFEGAHFK